MTTTSWKKIERNVFYRNLRRRYLAKRMGDALKLHVTTINYDIGPTFSIIYKKKTVSAHCH